MRRKEASARAAVNSARRAHSTPCQSSRLSRLMDSCRTEPSGIPRRRSGWVDVGEQHAGARGGASDATVGDDRRLTRDDAHDERMSGGGVIRSGAVAAGCAMGPRAGRPAPCHGAGTISRPAVRASRPAGSIAVAQRRHSRRVGLGDESRSPPGSSGRPSPGRCSPTVTTSSGWFAGRDHQAWGDGSRGIPWDPTAGRRRPSGPGGPRRRGPPGQSASATAAGPPPARADP